MSDEPTPQIDATEFKRDLTELIPHLRAFARSLCGNASQADDLAQEAMLKAWKSRQSYKPGTNMKAWTFTILRNHFYSEKRRSWRRQPLDPEVAEATLIANDNPDGGLELVALRNALNKLPDEQREALILVGAGGMPYEEAAEICGCAVGTIKSRVSRARKSLVEFMDSTDNRFSDGKRGDSARAFEDIMAEAAILSESPD